jgi:hypothetical protein
MNQHSSLLRPQQSLTELRNWMKKKYVFDRFITLSFNEPSDPDGCRKRLKSWDARMSRAMLGPQWSKMRDARMFGFFGLEKANRNAHWHGVIRLIPSEVKTRTQICIEFDANAVGAWKKLVPSGSADVKGIGDQTASDAFVDYMTTSVSFEGNWGRFIIPDEFSPQYPPFTLVASN